MVRFAVVVAWGFLLKTHSQFLNQLKAQDMPILLYDNHLCEALLTVIYFKAQFFRRALMIIWTWWSSSSATALTSTDATTRAGPPYTPQRLAESTVLRGNYFCKRIYVIIITVLFVLFFNTKSGNTDIL